MFAQGERDQLSVGELRSEVRAWRRLYVRASIVLVLGAIAWAVIGLSSDDSITVRTVDPATGVVRESTTRF